MKRKHAIHWPRRRHFPRPVVAVVLVLAAILLTFWIASQQPVFRGRTVAQWCAALHSSDGLDQGAVPPDVINAFGTNAAPCLVDLILARPNRVRARLNAAFSKLPELIRNYTSPLNRHLVRVRAMNWLKDLGADAEHLVPRLIDAALDPRDIQLQRNAIGALTAAGANSSEALDALVRLLQDPASKAVHEDAVSAIGRFGPNAKAAVPLLMERIRKDPQRDPYVEIYALGSIGPAAVEAVPTILGAMSRSAYARTNAFVSFSKIGSNAVAAVPVLVEALDASTPGLRMLALEALMRIGPPARTALPRVSALEMHTSANLRVMAIVTRASLEGDLSHALEDLLNELKTPSKEWGADQFAISFPLHAWPKRVGIGVTAAEMAAWFLGEIGPEAQQAIPFLREAMKRPRGPEVQAIYALAKWHIDQDAEECLAVLLESLRRKVPDPPSKNPVPLELEAVFSALSDMGDPAKPAVPDLIEFVNNRTNRWAYRREAWHLLKRLDPERAASTKFQ